MQIGELSNADIIQAVRDIAECEGWGFRDDYSGRGMYDKTCVGVVTDNPIRCIEKVTKEIGLTGASIDGMGTKNIVYWPRLRGE